MTRSKSIDRRLAAAGVGAAGVLLALVAACASPSGQPSPSATPFGGASPPAEDALAACEPISLQLTSGDELDLTGTWTGDDLGPYQLRQFGDCLWWVGQNGTYTYLFTGRLADDFTITGRWATIAASDRRIGTAVNYGYNWIGTGTLTLDINDADGTNPAVVLTKVADTYDQGFDPGYPIAVTTWTRVDTEPDHPVPAASGQ